VWGCPIEAKPYRPHEKKLDERTVSCYFIGYPERSRGYKFYNPTEFSVFETGNAKFFEDVEFVGGDTIMDFEFEEECANIPTGVESFLDIEPILTQNTIVENETIIEDQTQQDQTTQREIIDDVVVGQIVHNNAGNP